jgi:hypothetical protein
MDIPEAIQKVAEVIAGGLYKYAAALAAVGLVSMAIIQTVKDMLPTRRWFQDWRVRTWLRDQAAKAPSIPGGPPIQKVAEDDLVTLATSGDRAALFDLPIEQVSGLMNAASQIVLDFPPDHRDLLLCLAAQARPEDLELLLTQGPSATRPRATLGELERVQFVDARNRVTHQLQRSLDGLQISVGFRWKWIIQMLSIVVSAVLVWTGLALFAGDRVGSNFHYFLLYLLAGLLGGFLAPVARDLVAALQQFRK